MAPAMTTRNQLIVGWAALGAALGLALYPWVHIVTTRTRVAEFTSVSWLLIFFGVVFVPAILFAFMGASRAPRGSASP